LGRQERNSNSEKRIRAKGERGGFIRRPEKISGRGDNKRVGGEGALRHAEEGRGGM